MGHQLYLENEVMTATPGKLVVMLYDGAIRFLKRLDGLDYASDIETKNYNIKKAYAIISELQLTLNMDYKEVSDPLFSMYSYMNKRLMEANLNNDPKIIEEVIGLLKELRGSWMEIASKGHSEENVVVQNNEGLGSIQATNNDGITQTEEQSSFSMAC